jgi:hypothetical protein
MDDSLGWIRTQRTNPQPWIFLAVSLLFVLAGDYFLATSGAPTVEGVPTWVIPASAILLTVVAIQLYVFNVRRPRAVRLTATAIEVRTLFGGLIRIPREQARIGESWPAGFGSLKSPNLKAWVALDPNQFSHFRDSESARAPSVHSDRIAADEGPVERLRKLIAATAQVPVHEMRESPGFRGTPVVRPVTEAGLFFVPAFSLIIAFTIWLNFSRPGYFGPAWAVWPLVAFTVVLVVVMVWFVGVGSTTFGIAVSNDGILVFDRPLRRGIALKRTIPWGAVSAPKVQRGRRIWIDADVIGTYLTLDQARLVLTDPRCPLRDRLPSDVSQAIGLN